MMRGQKNIQLSVRNYHSTKRNIPKDHRPQVFIIFDANFYTCPNQHVGNDTMGTGALGAK